MKQDPPLEITIRRELGKTHQQSEVAFLKIIAPQANRPHDPKEHFSLRAIKSLQFPEVTGKIEIGNGGAYVPTLY